MDTVEKKKYLCKHCKAEVVANLKPGDVLICEHCGELIYG